MDINWYLVLVWHIGYIIQVLDTGLWTMDY